MFIISTLPIQSSGNSLNCPHKNLLTTSSCQGYTSLNKVKGTSCNGYRMCVQCGGKQHTSTLCPTYILLRPDWTGGPLCILSRRRTLLSPKSIFFSVINHMKCSPYSWNKFTLIQFVIHISYTLLVLLCSILILFSQPWRQQVEA